MFRTTVPWQERLEKHLKHSIYVTAEDCWIWQRALNKGYAVMRVGNRTRFVSQLIIEYVTGKPPLNQALHHCNHPACVNPSHIYDGTQAENIKQAVKDGRVKPPFKLKPEVVQAYKNLLAQGLSQRAAARRCNISEASASRIANGKY